MLAIENILNKALHLRPSERALLVQRLISSLSEEDDSIEQQWLELSQQRLKELKGKKVKGLTWNEIRSSVKGE